MAEVGCQGRISYGDVYRSSQIFKELKGNILNFAPNFFKNQSHTGKILRINTINPSYHLRVSQMMPAL